MKCSRTICLALLVAVDLALASHGLCAPSSEDPVYGPNELGVSSSVIREEQRTLLVEAVDTARHEERLLEVHGRLERGLQHWLTIVLESDRVKDRGLFDSTEVLHTWYADKFARAQAAARKLAIELGAARDDLETITDLFRDEPINADWYRGISRMYPEVVRLVTLHNVLVSYCTARDLQYDTKWFLDETNAPVLDGLREQELLDFPPLRDEPYVERRLEQDIRRERVVAEGNARGRRDYKREAETAHEVAVAIERDVARVYLAAIKAHKLAMAKGMSVVAPEGWSEGAETRFAHETNVPWGGYSAFKETVKPAMTDVAIEVGCLVAYRNALAALLDVAKRYHVDNGLVTELEVLDKYLARQTGTYGAVHVTYNAPGLRKRTFPLFPVEDIVERLSYPVDMDELRAPPAGATLTRHVRIDG